MSQMSDNESLLNKLLKWLLKPWSKLLFKELLEAVTVTDLLDDIPGGDINLLPISATEKDLEVIVPMWPVSDPRPGRPELLKLLWDEVEVDQGSWEAPVQPGDLILSVPKDKLTDGPHVLRYEVTNANLDTSLSKTLEVLIDLQAPVLGAGQGLLTVVEDPEEIERDGLTERYLRNHDQRLRTQVPGYITPKAGDTVIYYWDTEPFAEMEAGEHELTFEDTIRPVYIDFPGALVLERGDGDRYVYYAIKDRAGNISVFPRPLKLSVSAGLRALPLLSIEQTTGDQENLHLALNDLAPPLLIKVPAEAVVYTDETLRVEWGQPGDPGYYSTSTEYQGRSRQFEIPEDKVAAQGATTIQVNYVVSGDKRHDYPSPPVGLTVGSLSRGLPVVQLAGVRNGIFKLSDADERNRVTLGTWKFMAEGQWVDIWVTGTLSNGQEAEPHQVLKNYAIEADDVENGIGARNDVVVLKSYLSTLLLNNPFTVHVNVSFNQGYSWVKFPEMRPQLQS